VRQLDLDARGELPSRWMAHHVAELIDAAEQSEGEEKRLAEERAVTLIQKLWSNRRALPSPADPLAGYAPAIKLLSTMVPGGDPWSVYGRQSSNDGLLRDMYAALVHLVMSGLLLTRGQEIRAIDEAERRVLSEEELQLIGFFERWRPFFATPLPKEGALDELYKRFITGDLDPVVEEQAASKPDNAALPDLDAERRAILSHAELFQARLATLIENWRKTLSAEQPEQLEEDE
jgi:hypothetical protein